jgi:glutamyl-tRNA reductase
MRASPDRPERIVVVGTSHRSSTMSFRDRLAVDEAALPRVLERLRKAGCGEALVMATPERVEVLAVHTRPGEAVDAIRGVLMERAGLEAGDPAARFHAFRGAEAVRHLFHVAAGMESVVPGDPQAAADLGAARETSRRQGALGPTLESLVGDAIEAASRIGADTGLAARPATIAAAAVELARDIHGDLSRAEALVLGPGEMGELLAEALIAAGLGKAVLTGRSATRLEQMARRLKCPLVPFDALDAALEGADIVIASQGSSPPALSAARMEAALKRRRRRPVLLLDAAIPGDVERQVNDLDGAFLYDMGDLERFVMERGVARLEAAKQAAELADQAAKSWLGRLEAGEGAERDKGLRQRLEELRRVALQETGDAAAATRLLIERLAAEIKGRGRGGGEG